MSDMTRHERLGKVLWEAAHGIAAAWPSQTHETRDQVMRHAAAVEAAVREEIVASLSERPGGYPSPFIVWMNAQCGGGSDVSLIATWIESGAYAAARVREPRT